MKVAHIGKASNTNPPRVYKCDGCGDMFTWSSGSSWFGSYAQMENEPSKIKFYCSEKCQPKQP